MTQQERGRRKLNAASSPQPRYKTLALPQATYDKVLVWADHLRDEWGRCTIAQAIDFLVESAGVPDKEE